MIVKSRPRIIQELDASSLTVLGCPGADGLGAGALSVFHAGLSGAKGDFIVVLGDVSPLGRDPYYRRAADFINNVAQKPVYVLRGNHDGPDYGEYFGPENSAVLSEEYLLIMLDNSQRRFSDETLAFLRETMALVGSTNVFIAFHVPPPNRFSGHSMPRKEWQRFEDAVGVWRSRISLLLSSHAHNGFEDEVDGLRLVVTGGGGARMHAAGKLARQEHHALEITLDGGRPEVAMRKLSAEGGSVPEALREAYDERCRSRVELQFRAGEADAAGAHNLARLYRAGSESSLRHARNLRSLPADGGELFRLAVEEAEAGKLLFTELLYKAAGGIGGGDIGWERYFVCQSCGMPHALGVGPTYCPACGAPGHFVEAVE